VVLAPVEHRRSASYNVMNANFLHEKGTLEYSIWSLD